MADDRSPACAYGQPGERHRCVGCGCTCHLVRPPANFRRLVQRARERHRAQEAQGDLLAEAEADADHDGQEGP